MTVTERDKKILAVLAVIGVLAAYWFLLLGPKREEAARLDEQIATQQEQRDAAVAQAQAAESAKRSFADDYAEMVRLGKAIPSEVDMPSLLVQLDRAAGGTHIDLDSITVGPRATAGAAKQPAVAAAPSGGTAGSSGETAGGSGGASGGSGGASDEQLDTQTSTNVRDGAVPVGGGGAATSSAGAGATSASAVPGLDTVPIEFTFTGSYFDLASFFHRLKRFVHVNGDRIVVRGRLMTIDGITFSNEQGDADASPGGDLEAKVTATVYLAPKDEGVTAGATPSGPADPTQGSEATASATPPTATVKP
jgi:hypothetical protein